MTGQTVLLLSVTMGILDCLIKLYGARMNVLSGLGMVSGIRALNIGSSGDESLAICA